eukprot:357001-Chlamydomonas_euryale.AAC.5
MLRSSRGVGAGVLRRLDAGATAGFGAATCGDGLAGSLGRVAAAMRPPPEIGFDILAKTRALGADQRERLQGRAPATLSL